jgi:hypothetical protein
MSLSRFTLAEWRSALESLTPGGSEFSDSPGNCVRYVRDRLITPRRMLEAEAKTSQLLVAAASMLEALSLEYHSTIATDFPGPLMDAAIALNIAIQKANDGG